MEKDIDDLMEDFEEFRDAENERKRLEIKAYEFAKRAHEGQFRDEGTPYFEHIERVAKLTNDEFHETRKNIIALLHDVVEDTSYTVEDIKREFGDYTAHCVELLTKTDKTLDFYFEKLQENYTALTIKILDRYDNLLSLKFTPKKDKVKRKIEETEKYFYPIFEKNIDNTFFLKYKNNFNKVIEELNETTR